MCKRYAVRRTDQCGSLLTTEEAESPLFDPSGTLPITRWTCSNTQIRKISTYFRSSQHLLAISRPYSLSTCLRPLSLTLAIRVRDKMLYYVDELMMAMNAAPGRRRFNIVGGVLIILVSTALISFGAPALILYAVICVGLVVHLTLVVLWARRDALEAHRQGEIVSP
jgi:hypothetical protein